RLVAKVVRAAAFADLQVHRLVDVAHAVHERVLRRLRLSQRLEIAAQRVDVTAAVGAELPLEAPTPEREESRLDPIEHLRGIESVLQVALEDVGPQIVLFDRQALELEAAARAEVVVRDE